MHGKMLAVLTELPASPSICFCLFRNMNALNTITMIILKLGVKLREVMQLSQDHRAGRGVCCILNPAPPEVLLHKTQHWSLGSAGFCSGRVGWPTCDPGPRYPAALPRSPVAVFAGGMNVTELHIGPTGHGLLVAEPASRAIPAGAIQAGPIAGNAVITCPMNAQTF